MTINSDNKYEDLLVTRIMPKASFARWRSLVEGNVEAWREAGRECREIKPKEYTEWAPCAHSTQAKPGTAEKIEVLRARVANKEQLWHPKDNLQKI
jgi:hypothetical protein